MQGDYGKGYFWDLLEQNPRDVISRHFPRLNGRLEGDALFCHYHYVADCSDAYILPAFQSCAKNADHIDKINFWILRECSLSKA